MSCHPERKRGASPMGVDHTSQIDWPLCCGEIPHRSEPDGRFYAIRDDTLRNVVMPMVSIHGLRYSIFPREPELSRSRFETRAVARHCSIANRIRAMRFRWCCRARRSRVAHRGRAER